MEFIEEEGRICVREERGGVIAEVLFRDEGEKTVCVTRTYVDEALRGQGIAGKLIEEAAKSALRRGRKLIAACSYAEAWLSKHAECKAEERP